MRFRSLLAELRRRGVLKVAAAYLATGWVTLEGVSILFHNFEAPNWVLKVFSTLVMLGFPVACLLAWGFEMTPQGIRSAAPLHSGPPAEPRRSDTLLAVLVVATMSLLAATLVNQWRSPTTTATSARTEPAVVIMDTSAPRGVYDEDVRVAGGTNADTLNETLRDLPIVIYKELVGATWDREDQLMKLEPDLILIHRSALFHPMNQEFGFGYPGEEAFDEPRARRLYELADNRFGALLGFIGERNSRTRILVYSRGTFLDWDDEQVRDDWVRRHESRFPALQGRISTIAIPGGVEGGSMRDQRTRQLFRQRVQKLLGLGADGEH